MIKHTLKGTNIELTPAISSYVDSKLADIEKLTNPADTSTSASIEVGKTTDHHQHGDIFRAEINLHVAGRTLRATSERDNLYAAIDDIKDEMLRELKHYKSKRLTLARRGAAKLKRLLRFGERE